jgi:hypothetical protein
MKATLVVFSIETLDKMLAILVLIVNVIRENKLKH